MASFEVRLESDDPRLAHGVAQALHAELVRRGAVADVTPALVAGERPALVVGVRDESARARWLAPHVLSKDPAAALGQAISFLERWGFLARPARP